MADMLCDECKHLISLGDYVTYCGLILHRWCADKAELEVDRMLEDEEWRRERHEEAFYDYWEERVS